MKVELGCGNNKKEGFYGLDIQRGPQVDLVINIEETKLPFDNDSVDYLYSSHTFEHLTHYPFVLQEILRVCKHDATLEIWTPYGKSNDGLLFGHYTFMTETHFKHICYEYDRFYLGDNKGYFEWYKTHYNMFPGIVDTLASMNIPLDFAMDHMFNIALEWGVFMKVKKDKYKAYSPQIPEKIYSYGRGNMIDLNPKKNEVVEPV